MVSCMVKGKFIDFIKDKLFFSVIMLLNTIFIFLFFYCTVDKQVEFKYPIIITVFMFSIFIIIEWFRYFRFNCELDKSIDDFNYKITVSTCEQKKVSDVISKIHSSYMKKINDLEEQNDIKNKLLAQWIHKLKTPVTVIDLILQREKNGRFADEDIEALKRENKVMYDNLQNVLNLIRLEEFSRDYVPAPVNLLNSINRVIKNNKNLFIYNNVFPKVEIEDENMTVLCDEKWNEFLLEQIVANAIKYSSGGNENKFIYFKTEAEREGYITLKIADEGIGIPAYDLPRVFNPFFTGENGRKYKNSTGIGLYICSIIAEKLGLKLKLESEVNKGTVMQVRYMSKS